MMTVLAALAGGASRVILADLMQEKLDLMSGNPTVTTVNIGVTGTASNPSGASGVIGINASGAGASASTSANYTVADPFTLS